MQMFLTSPRNSVPAHLDLFHRLKCRTLLSPVSRAAAVTAINDVEQMRILEVPEVEYFLGQSSTQYPYENEFLAAQDDPLFVV